MNCMPTSSPSARCAQHSVLPSVPSSTCFLVACVLWPFSWRCTSASRGPDVSSSHLVSHLDLFLPSDHPNFCAPHISSSLLGPVKSVGGGLFFFFLLRCIFFFLNMWGWILLELESQVFVSCQVWVLRPAPGPL